MRLIAKHLFVVLLANAVAVYYIFNMLGVFTQDNEFLSGRPWWNNYPTDDWDHFRVYVFYDNDYNGKGLRTDYFDGSELKCTRYIGVWSRKDQEINFKWLFNKQTSSSPFKITRCHHGMFDLMLEIEHDPQNDGKPMVYYSQINPHWNIRKF